MAERCSAETKSTTATSAPSRANATAIPAPIPEAAPVPTAVRPWRRPAAGGRNGAVNGLLLVLSQP